MRLIDADVLIKEYCKWFHDNPEEADSTDDDIYDFIKKVEEQPMIDAQPIIHAHWERTDDGYGCCCSNCGGVIYDGNISKYCPNCGARVDEVEDE